MSECDHKGAGFGYCYRCGAVTDGSDVEEETIESLRKELAEANAKLRSALKWLQVMGAAHANAQAELERILGDEP